MKRIQMQYLARQFKRFTPFAVLPIVCAACQVLTYTGPNGERFTRSALATTTSISSLSVETDTNGIRRVQMEGYQNDATQALGIVTEAAVRAALRR